MFSYVLISRALICIVIFQEDSHLHNENPPFSFSFSSFHFWMWSYGMELDSRSDWITCPSNVPSLPLAHSQTPGSWRLEENLSAVPALLSMRQNFSGTARHCSSYKYSIIWSVVELQHSIIWSVVGKLNSIPDRPSTEDILRLSIFICRLLTQISFRQCRKKQQFPWERSSYLHSLFHIFHIPFSLLSPPEGLLFYAYKKTTTAQYINVRDSDEISFF